ncbi:glutathionylspermidine synthase family protein [Paenibacillus sp. 481]|uniref:glutathionylspermidine synthase family protein n=1 Tax=Paenibacillus sp. 481 TaxID=2835869 RepID=UPI001E469D45|nr:glutathionylspermidine synthase family protein [Paenibacillus sp. 481]UHA72827.1 glutathionylspermidine synthase family protein [Paenibacillus sp. 481]
MRRTFRMPFTAAQAFQGERLRTVPYVRMHGKPYCLTTAVGYTEEELAALRTAAEQMHRVFVKALRFVQTELPDVSLVNQLGIHPSLVEAARRQCPHTGIARQDWILGPEGWKCIENNADTPTGIPEAAYLSGSLLAELEQEQGQRQRLELEETRDAVRDTVKELGRNPGRDPGREPAATGTGCKLHNISAPLAERLQAALCDLLRWYEQQGLGRKVVFSSFGDHSEDRANTLFLMELVQAAGWDATYVPLEQMELRPEEGLFANGERVYIWYRLYPLEYLIHDQSPSGFPVGEHLMRLVAEGKLGLLNPSQSIILQSKALMALIWTLVEHQSEWSDWLTDEHVFDEQDVCAIRTYLPPTYTTPEPFIRQRIPYVAKGLWGREGKGTTRYDEHGQAIKDEDRDSEQANVQQEQREILHYYENQSKVYQQLIPMERVQLDTEDGQLEGYLLTGVYVPNGTFGGVLPRVGGLVTGDLASYAPGWLYTSHN